MKWFTSLVLPTDLTLYNGTGLKQIAIIENLIPLQIPAYQAVTGKFFMNYIKNYRAALRRIETGRYGICQYKRIPKIGTIRRSI